MNLKVLLPTEILIDQPVMKIIAEAENGSFCLLPKHVDFISALLPGILTFVDEQNCEYYLGIGGGILTKSVSLPSMQFKETTWEHSVRKSQNNLKP
jgi:F-type H+-transporting ATPase subunit epsilon